MSAAPHSCGSRSPYRPGQWLGNGKRAYKFVRMRRGFGAPLLVLEDTSGMPFETTQKALEAGGYQPLTHKPRYAGRRQWTRRLNSLS